MKTIAKNIKYYQIIFYKNMQEINTKNYRTLTKKSQKTKINGKIILFMDHSSINSS